MKKILFILHYPPPIHGAAIVGQYIRESRHINNYFDCKYIQLGTAQSLVEIRKISIKKIFALFPLLLETFSTIITFKPELVYITPTAKGIGFYKDAIVIILAKILRCKLALHLHNKGVHDRQNKLFDNILYNIVFKKSNVILLSNNLYSDIGKYVRVNKMHVCPNGIPPIIIDYNNIDQKSNNDSVNILFLSNLLKEKGIFILIEACDLLKERNIEFNCNIIGDEGDVSIVELLDHIRKKGLLKNINYLGPIFDSKKYKYFIDADLFAFPSLNECFSLVLLEAMRFALPIVSTIEGGIPDVVEESKTGFLVNKNDSKALADKLEILINDKSLREQMGEAGKERYLNNFTIDHFEKRFVNILDEILRKYDS